MDINSNSILCSVFIHQYTKDGVAIDEIKIKKYGSDHLNHQISQQERKTAAINNTETIGISSNEFNRQMITNNNNSENEFPLNKKRKIDITRRIISCSQTKSEPTNLRRSARIMEKKAKSLQEKNNEVISVSEPTNLRRSARIMEKKAKNLLKLNNEVITVANVKTDNSKDNSLLSSVISADINQHAKIPTNGETDINKGYQTNSLLAKQSSISSPENEKFILPSKNLIPNLILVEKSNCKLKSTISKKVLDGKSTIVKTKGGKNANSMPKKIIVDETSRIVSCSQTESEPAKLRRSARIMEKKAKILQELNNEVISVTNVKIDNSKDNSLLSSVISAGINQHAKVPTNSETDINKGYQTNSSLAKQSSISSPENEKFILPSKLVEKSNCKLKSTISEKVLDGKSTIAKTKGGKNANSMPKKIIVDETSRIISCSQTESEPANLRRSARIMEKKTKSLQELNNEVISVTSVKTDNSKDNLFSSVISGGIIYDVEMTNCETDISDNNQTSPLLTRKLTISSQEHEGIILPSKFREKSKGTLKPGNRKVVFDDKSLGAEKDANSVSNNNNLHRSKNDEADVSAIVKTDDSKENAVQKIIIPHAELVKINLKGKNVSTSGNSSDASELIIKQSVKRKAVPELLESLPPGYIKKIKNEIKTEDEAETHEDGSYDTQSYSKRKRCRIDVNDPMINAITIDKFKQPANMISNNETKKNWLHSGVAVLEGDYKNDVKSEEVNLTKSQGIISKTTKHTNCGTQAKEIILRRSQRIMNRNLNAIH